MIVDLNCDLGEGCPHDAELLPLITTANVACGWHAGGADQALMIIELAAKCGVRVGAHPSFPDREQFGRREMVRTERQILEDCVYQIGALAGLAKVVRMELTHVKPHGALYNMACRDDAYARPVVHAAEIFNLPIVGLPGSRLESACHGKLVFIPEGYADRRYRLDGSLVPRSEPGAFVESAAEAVQHVLSLLQLRRIRTICVHGDNPQAVSFVRELRSALVQRGVEIRAFA